MNPMDTNTMLNARAIQNSFFAHNLRTWTLTTGIILLMAHALT